MTEKRRGLGRGLGALIPNAAEPARVNRPTDVFFTEQKREASAPSDRSSRFGEALSPRPSYAPARVTEPRTAPHGTVRTEVAPSPEHQSEASRSTDGNESAVARHGHPAPPAAAHVSRETELAKLDEIQPLRTSVEDSAAPDVSVPASTESGDAETKLKPVPGASFAELDPKQIRPNPKQPRHVFNEEDMAELVHSIGEIGVLQPIVVRPVPESDPEHSRTPYELIMGERRWRATQAAGLDAVPAIIRSTTDEDLLRDALLENLHRSQLNPLEEAAAYAQLLEDFGCTHDELAEKIGRSRPQITNTIRLMKLPPSVQRRVAAGVLSSGHARALLGLKDSDAMERLAARIVAEGLSVRATEEIVAVGDDSKPRRQTLARESNPELDVWATNLADRLDTRVGITMGKKKGKLTVEFASVEDLNRIMDALGIQRD